ncbi:MAG: hypothetical protein ACJAYP_000207 [Flavobacterium sp.]|jgi:hypothetical protein
MVVLKKIRSATLMETLVATVIIVLVFLISSMVINNIFFNTFHQKRQLIETSLNELEYKYYNNLIDLPYNANLENWNVEVFLEEDNKVIFKATNAFTQKELVHKIYKNE